MNGKIAGAIVGAILVAVLFGIVRLYGKNSGQKGVQGQIGQKHR